MKKTINRLLAVLMAMMLLTGCAAQAESTEAPPEAPVNHTVTGQAYPFLLQLDDHDGTHEEGEMNLYFVDGGDIPYVALSEYTQFLSVLLDRKDKSGVVYEIASEGEDELFHYTATRPDNGSTLYVFPEKDMMIFSNYNTFTQMVGAKMLVSAMDIPEVESFSPMDLVTLVNESQQTAPEQEQAEENPESAADAEEPTEGATAPEEKEPAEKSGIPAMFTLKKGMYLNRPGDEVVLNLANYTIDIIEADGECYIPFQTLNDLLVGDEYVYIVFTGEMIICAGYGCSLIDLMDSAPKHDLSEEFARFNFHELCLLLDCKYGLKPEHNIDSFSKFIVNNEELFGNLISTNPMLSSFAIANLTFTYFDDLHSGFRRGSYQFDRDRNLEAMISMGYYGPSMRNFMKRSKIFENARKAVYRAWVPGYEEVGDTAFITFDHFEVNRKDYYDISIDRDNPQDTIDLIIYANSQIKREDSPIRNIVLDLSNNGGGDATAAIFVISWFLGEADIALRDTFTGAETNAVYLADVNLDGEFDDQDNVASGYRLYCLTSNSSFSCGNLVPAACRGSGLVTLIGQTTGGGSCVVLPSTTAAGTIFQISGNKQISIMRNGSFYNTDAGVEPDFRLDKAESYYDRPALAEYLNNLK